jgi:hypothetical protein
MMKILFWKQRIRKEVKMEEESHERRTTGHRRFVSIPLAMAMMVGGVAGITSVNTGQAASSGVIPSPGDAAT